MQISEKHSLRVMEPLQKYKLHGLERLFPNRVTARDAFPMCVPWEWRSPGPRESLTLGF